MGGSDAVSGVVFVFGPQERNGERHPGGDHGYIGLIMFSSSWASQFKLSFYREAPWGQPRIHRASSIAFSSSTPSLDKPFEKMDMKVMVKKSH